MANTPPSFTVGYGRLTTDFGGKGDAGYALAVQSDGKFVLAGRSDNGSNYDIAVARYNPDGSLDTGFSGDGRLTTAIGAGDDAALSVAIQADGKVVVAGYSYNGSNNDFAVVRYNVDGSLDATFSGDGKLTKAVGSGYDMASGVTILQDGKILVAGSTQNGSNYDFAQVRYNADGTLDTSFDGDGTLTAAAGGSNDTGESVVAQGDGKILVAGFSYNGSDNDFSLTRYNADGSLDAGFGVAGKLTTAVGQRDDVGRAIALQADGRILVAGSTWVPTNPDDFFFNTDFALVRYNADGSLDTSFGSGGIATVNVRSIRAGDDAFSVRVLDDGKILVAGTSDSGFPADFALARFNADGSLDTSFGGAYSLGGTAAFTTLGAAVVLDSSVAIADAELDARNGGAGDYAGAIVTLARHGGARSDDMFDFAAPGATFTVAGNSLLAGGQAFGTWSQSGGTLSIALTSSATVATNALVDNVLEHITYRNSGFAPPPSIQIDWTLTDSQVIAGQPLPPLADMPRSVTGSTTVNITAISHSNTAPDFGTLPPGIVTTPVGAGRDEAHGIALQADGKLLVAGHSYSGSNSDFALVRYNADGSLDTGFSGDGRLTTAIGSSTDYASSIAVQADGRILVAGQSYSGSSGAFLSVAVIVGSPLWAMSLARYNADGSLDTSFSGDGKLTTTFGGSNTYGQSLAVQADGRILLAGSSLGASSNVALLRYNADGSFDNGFGSGGGVTTDIGSGTTDGGSSIAVQADGRILVAGSSGSGGNDDFALVRYKADGSLDTSFSGDGKLTTAIGSGNDTGYSLAVQPDGKILVAGSSHNGSDDDFAVVRCNADGSLDTGFGGDGMVTTAIGSAHDLASAMALQADGKVVLAGYSWNGSDYDIALTRYNNDGSLDTSFGGDGIVTTDVAGVSDYGYSVAVQPDGRIVVAGQTYRHSSPFSDSDFVVVRYNSDGSLDGGFEAAPTGRPVPRHFKGGPAVVIDSSLALADFELDALNAGAGDYAGASVSVARHGGANGDDAFGFAATGAGFSVAGTTLQHGGLTFATWSQAGGALSIAFTSAATPATHALVLDVLEHVTYANTSAAPPASVQIDWNFSDGNSGAQGTGGALAASAGSSIDIALVNNAPSIGNHGPRSFAPNQPLSLRLDMLFHDPDGDVLAFAANGLPAGLTIDAATGRISGTTPAATGVHHLTVTAADPGGLAASLEFDLGIVAGNSLTAQVLTRSGAALPGATLREVAGAAMHKYDLDGSGLFADTRTDSPLTLSVERGTADLLAHGKPISAADALDALKLSVGLAASQGKTWKELVAADMNGDHRVTATDALEILKASVGINTIQPGWVFVPGDAAGLAGMDKDNVRYGSEWSLASITAPAANSFTGILVGDVNNSWVIPAV